MKKGGYAQFNQVYVWEFPIRLFHWITMLSVLVLVVTGFFITTPFPVESNTEASFLYLFGWNRFLHFAFGYVFLFSFIGRFYWGFVGNDYARWRYHFPTSKKKWKEVWQVVCIDIVQICRLPVHSVGINALASIIYSLVYLLIVFQILTGFALYSLRSQSWFPKLFSWVLPLMGGESIVRQWHHLMLWVFVAFTALHIYLGWYHDYLEGRGTISSMVGGWKFIERVPEDDLSPMRE
jgi:Ni/Fe-hydrogenase 1 B-type cytochrome subunit